MKSKYVMLTLFAAFMLGMGCIFNALEKKSEINVPSTQIIYDSSDNDMKYELEDKLHD